jgi:putative addiction module component (TIGR02574 family)
MWLRRYSYVLYVCPPFGAAMMTPAEALSTQVDKLPPQERMQLVEHILDSLDQPDATLEALWAKEAEDRLGAYRRDEIKAIAHQHRKPDYWQGRL